MADLATRTFVLAPTSDRYLTLGSEEYVRTLTIGDSWNVLRLGIMAALPIDGTNNLTSCQGFLGVCSGTTNPRAAASTDHAVGIPLHGGLNGTAATMNYNAGSTYPYFSSAGNAQIGKRVGTTWTDASGSIATGGTIKLPTNTGALQRRGVVFVQFTKGTPWTVQGWVLTAAQAEDDFAYTANFLAALESSGTPALKGVSMTGGTSRTLSVDEISNGSLDTVDIYWNRSAFPIEIYALAAHRFS